MGTPVVTILLAVYNGAQWVHEALDSALAQKRVQFEIVVVDDGSTDETPGIVAEYARTYPDLLRWVRIDHGGLSRARNVGFDMARGEFITVIDADDTMHPLRSWCEVEGLRRHPEAVICFSKRWNFRSGTEYGVFRFRAQDIVGHEVSSYVRIDDPSRVLLDAGEYPGTSACTSRTSFSRGRGRYDEDQMSFVDGELWLRAVFDRAVVYCPVPVYLRRIHAESMSRPSEARLVQVYRATEKARRNWSRYSPGLRRSLVAFEKRVGVALARELMDAGYRRRAVVLLLRRGRKLRGRLWLRMLIRGVVGPERFDRVRQRPRTESQRKNGRAVVALEEVLAADVDAILGEHTGK